MPQNSSLSCHLDTATGFLWIATGAGLVRFDGNNCRVFSLGDIPGLRSSLIQGIYPLANGQVLGTDGTGYAFEISGAGTIITTNSLKPISFPGSLAQLYPGGLLPGVTVKGICWTDAHNWAVWSQDTVHFFKDTVLKNTVRIPERFDGLLNSVSDGFLLTEGNWNPGSEIRAYFINRSTYTVNRLAIRGRELVTDTAVLYYDHTSSTLALLSGRKVFRISAGSDGLQVENPIELPGLEQIHDINNLLFCFGGNTLIAGTPTQGAFIYKKSFFRNYLAPKGMAPLNAYAGVLLDSTHYFSAGGFRLDLVNGGVDPFINCFREHVAKDANGSIWYSSNTGASYYSAKEHRFFNGVTYPHYSGTLYMSFLPGSDGSFWVSAENMLYRYHPDGREEDYARGQHYPAFRYMIEKPDGKILAVGREGVYEVDTGNGKPELIVRCPIPWLIRSIYSDPENYLWIATQGAGGYVYEAGIKKLSRLPLDAEGSLKFCHVFIDEGNGMFLVPTNKGLLRTSRSQMLATARDPTRPFYYQYFGVESGIAGNEFNGGCQPAYTWLPDGSLLLPGIFGLLRVDTAKFNDGKAAVLFSEGFKGISGTLSGISFPASERDITWQFSYADWEQPYAPALSYQMDGGAWQGLEPGSRNLELHNLTGGDHRLTVRYRYGLRASDYNDTSYSFSIAYYYYEKAWFGLMVGVLLIASVMIAIRLRTRKLIQRTRQLEQKVTDRTQQLSTSNRDLNDAMVRLNKANSILQEHSIYKSHLVNVLGHDMLTPLQYMSRLSAHILAAEATGDHAELSKNVSDLAEIAARLQGLGENVIHWTKIQSEQFELKPDLIDIKAFLSSLRAELIPILKVKDNELVMVASGHEVFDHDQMLLKIILYNLIINANKYTRKGEIRILAGAEAHSLQITVQDNGGGMDEAVVASLNNRMHTKTSKGTLREKGFGIGYQLIFYLLNRCNGSIEIKSTPDLGTSVHLVFPEIVWGSKL